MSLVEFAMNRCIFTIAGEADAREAARMMRHHQVGSLLVTRNGTYVGIFTETDLARRVVAPGLDPATTPVGSVMSSPLATIESREPLVEAWHLMHTCGVRHLAVTADKEIVGVLSSRDLLQPIYGRDVVWAAMRSR